MKELLDVLANFIAQEFNSLSTLYTVAELRMVCCKVKQISTESLLREVERRLRNKSCINAQQLKKLTDGEDEKKTSSGRGRVRTKGRSTKAKKDKIHFNFQTNS
jgi:hypothetical protein